jgi:hypothetical protein
MWVKMYEEGVVKLAEDRFKHAGTWIDMEAQIPVTESAAPAKR